MRMLCMITRRRGEPVMIVGRLDVMQTRVRFSARYPMEVLLLLSEEAMRIQERQASAIVRDK
jgi:hypothetical protein